MKNKALKLFKWSLLIISLSLFTEMTYGQSILDLAQNGKGKRLVKKITAIELSYDSQHYVPLSGTGIGLQIIASLDKGKTVGTGSGTDQDIAWEFYSVTAEGGEFDPGTGMLTILGDQPVKVSATLISMPEIHSELLVDPLKIKEISVNQERITGGGAYLLTANAVLSDQRSISTSNGMLPWEKLDVKVTGADFLAGKLTLPESDYRGIKEDKISIGMFVKGQEDLRFTLDIPLLYDEEKTLYFNGERGRSGQTGTNGAAGESGKAGSGERAGGDGGNGQNGSDGSVGGNGANAGNVEVYVDIDKNKSGGNTILKVYVKSLGTGQERFLKVDPLKGKISIFANGGNGGQGGSGGTGGSGGSGGSGTVSGKAGNGGNGGNGGLGGDGSNGGNVTIYVHPEAKNYLSCIVVECNSGFGGDGGSPGSGGQCPNNCKAGENGKRGEPGRSGMVGKITIIEKETVLEWGGE
jgi:hypothetical protein